MKEELLYSKQVIDFEARIELFREFGFIFDDIDIYIFCKEEYLKYPSQSWYNVCEGVTHIGELDLETAERRYDERMNWFYGKGKMPNYD